MICDFEMFFLVTMHFNTANKKRRKRKEKRGGGSGYWHCTWCCRCAFLRSRSLGWESGSRRGYLWQIGIFWWGGRSHQMWRSWRLVLSKTYEWRPIISAPHVCRRGRYRTKGFIGFGWVERGGGVLDVQVLRQGWLEPGGIPQLLYGKRRSLLGWLGLFLIFF